MEQELTQLKEEIQRKRNYNGQRFLGGYTEPIINVFQRKYNGRN